jgi:hypothetical protein
MSKQRMVDTRFWDDAYTSNLDPIEKLMFLYFLTNTSTNISGIYEIPLKKIANETGIDKDMVEKIISRFEKDHKIYYREGWVGIVNFIKHQNQKSPQVMKGIERELEDVPGEIKGLVLEGMHTLSHLTKPNLTKLNLQGEQSSPEIPLLIKEFESINPAINRMYGNKTQRKACEDLLKLYDFDRLIKIIKETLPKTNAMQYFPTITTPLQLLEKYTSLESAIRKYQAGENKLKSNVAF